MSEVLQDLQDWYAAHCDGEWEHQHGISLETTDNPGWWVKIELAGTKLRNKPFPPLAERVNPSGYPLNRRWIRCYIDEEGVWNGAGDETKLSLILTTFLNWARS